MKDLRDLKDFDDTRCETYKRADLLVAGVEGESVVARVDHLVQDLGCGGSGVRLRV